eukprot:1150706-Pelagomonas_calceolata.AAC.2
MHAHIQPNWAIGHVIGTPNMYCCTEIWTGLVGNPVSSQPILDAPIIHEPFSDAQFGPAFLSNHHCFVTTNHSNAPYALMIHKSFSDAQFGPAFLLSHHCFVMTNYIYAPYALLIHEPFQRHELDTHLSSVTFALSQPDIFMLFMH